MYTFVPRLPTKWAWDNKPFNNAFTTAEVVKLLADKKQFYEGDIMVGYWPWKCRIPFRTVRELKEKLLELGTVEIVSRIHIYHVGYFALNNG
jgi:hypothetical protein